MPSPKPRKSRDASDSLKGQGMYIPGPLVPTIRLLIDAYRRGSTEEQDAALLNLAQALRGVEPKSTASIEPKTLTKPLDTITAEWTLVKKAPPAREIAEDSVVDWVSRLNRDYPAIAERYARGEFKTARDAAIAAGILVDSSSSVSHGSSTPNGRSTGPLIDEGNHAGKNRGMGVRHG